MKIAIINGANLNMLGVRKKEVYGTETLEDINLYIKQRFPQIDFTFFQSNHEGAIIDYIQSVQADGVVINGGAHTHYSIAIRDAIESRDGVPFVEVHISDISVREEFRHISYLTDVCEVTFAGFGKDSYIKGVEFLLGEQNEQF